MQNPEMMSQLMQNPMMQQSMQMLMSNPELMRQAMQNSPMLAGNPEMVRYPYWKMLMSIIILSPFTPQAAQFSQMVRNITRHMPCCVQHYQTLKFNLWL